MDNVYDILMKENLVYVLPEKALVRTCDDEALASTVILVNLYYPDTLKFYFEYISQIPDKVNIYIISSNPSAEKEIMDFVNQNRYRHYIRKDNRGRDVSALLVAAREIISGYKYVCFVHDKKPNFKYLEEDIRYWIKNLWDNTLKSNQYICNMIGLLEEQKEIGLLIPPKPIGMHMPDWYIDAWHDDFETVEQLCKELDLDCDLDVDKPVITLGTVFWGRTQALEKLFLKNWRYEDFSEEPMPIDGTVSHGLERILAYVVQDAGLLTGIVMCDSYAASLYVKVQEIMRITYKNLQKNFYIGQVDQLIHYEKQKRLVEEAFQNNRNVYLYGAGKYGQRFLKMMQLWGYSPTGFLVSDGHKKRENLEGYPVWELKEFHDTNACILITTNYDSHMEMEKNLKKYGIDDYFIAC